MLRERSGRVKTTRRLLMLILTVSTLLACCALSLSCAIAWRVSSGLIHPPRPTLASDPVRAADGSAPRPRTPEDLGLAYRNIAFTGGEGLTVRGWYLPGADGDDRAVVFGHGNASNRRFGLCCAALLHERGYHLLLIDFSGRGDSDGDIVTYGKRESEDLRRAVGFVRTLAGLGGARVALWGISMGASSAIFAASGNPQIAAVVADSPFASFGDAVREGARRRGLPRFPAVPLLRLMVRLRGGYDYETIVPERAARSLTCPLFLMHGLEDRQIAPSHSERILAAARGPKEFLPLPGLGHNDPRPPEAIERAMAFLDEAIPPPGPKAARN